MRKLALCLTALLVMATLAEDVEAGRRHRRRARRCYYYQPCVPCQPCVPTCVAPSGFQPSLPLSEAAPGVPTSSSACVCPYYEMMGIWYGERFEAINGIYDCLNPYPTGHPGPGPMYCTPNTCGCYPVAFFDPQPTPPGHCYLADCISHDRPLPPNHDDDHARKLTGPHHLRIVEIDSTAVTREIYVAYYHMQATHPHTGSKIPFWVGFECTKPPRPVGRRVKAETVKIHQPNEEEGAPPKPCPGLVRVFPGGSGQGQNTKDIIIQLTKDGCK